MSGKDNPSRSGSTSNLPESTYRPSQSSLSSLTGATSQGFHQSGSLQGMQNIHGSFNVPNIPGALASQNSTVIRMPPAGMQQAAGGFSGRPFISHLTGAPSQMSHGSAAGYSGMTGRGVSLIGSHGYGVGGSIPGELPAYATSSNCNTIPGMAVSPMLTNPGQRISSSSMVGGGNVGWNTSSGGGFNIPGHDSRLSLSGISGTGSLTIPGSNRSMGGFQQASPQGISMPGNLHLPQNSFQTPTSFSTMGMLGGMNNSESSSFDVNNFPQLTSRPKSAGGHQQQSGSMRKPGLGVGQQHQEFTFRNEDFPALTGFKGRNIDYAKDLHQKDHLRDNTASMTSHHFSSGRSAGFDIGDNYPTNRSQQQSTSGNSSGINFSQFSNQDVLPSQSSSMFPMSQSNSHAPAQSKGLSGKGLRPHNSSSTVTGKGSYDQLTQGHQNQSQYRLPQTSSTGQIDRDLSTKPVQESQSAPDQFGLLGLVDIIKNINPGLTSLAIGYDPTSLGLNVTSAENIHPDFSSPFSDKPAKGDPEFSVPQCYYAKPPPPLNPSNFSKFQLEAIFYIFYSMPKDKMQLHAAIELYKRGWFYHKEHRLWLKRAPNSELLVSTNTYEKGSYLCFDPNTFGIIQKDNFVLQYELLEKKPTLPQH